MRRLFMLAACAAVTATIVGVGVARADTALTVGGGWQQFNWDSQTQSAVPYQTPFTFTTTKSVRLEITDVLCPGEVFTVYDNGVLLGQTSPPRVFTCDYAGSTGDPDAALKDPTYSGAIATLDAGTHSITIIVSTNGYPNGSGYIRVDYPSVSIQSAKGDNRYLAVKKFH
jgi:hypothetical protein